MRRHIPQDGILHSHRREHFKSCTKVAVYSLRSKGKHEFSTAYMNEQVVQRYFYRFVFGWCSVRLATRKLTVLKGFGDFHLSTREKGQQTTMTAKQAAIRQPLVSKGSVIKHVSTAVRGYNNRERVF
jgi:hypothetical protein